MVNWRELVSKTREHKIAKKMSLLINQQAKKTGTKQRSCVSKDNLMAVFEKEYLLSLPGKKRIILCAIQPEETAVIINIALNQIENFP